MEKKPIPLTRDLFKRGTRFCTKIYKYDYYKIKGSGMQNSLIIVKKQGQYFGEVLEVKEDGFVLGKTIMEQEVSIFIPFSELEFIPRAKDEHYY
ncbi:MAG: hypothetical protein QHC79_09735 [Pseudosphingobacterium sp.]|nr:hypothetical protein [Pseudosphingobacterium sp.]